MSKMNDHSATHYPNPHLPPPEQKSLPVATLLLMFALSLCSLPLTAAAWLFGVICSFVANAWLAGYRHGKTGKRSPEQ